MNVLLLIPARHGSKRVPGKNLRAIGGASLVGRAVNCAREFCGGVPSLRATIFVDTDSAEIAAEARAWGAEVPFLRPSALATDDAATIDVVLNALGRFEQRGQTFDAVILLQPTSPLRSAADVAACWQRFDPPAGPSVVSLCATSHPPELALHLDERGVVTWASGPPSHTRRQSYRAAYWPSGAVYVASVQFLRSRHAFIEPGITIGVGLPSRRSVDVDTEDDLAAAESLARRATIAVTTIGAREVGPGRPCLVIAEAGVNHNGDVQRALELVDAAAAAGADAVKFQAFVPEKLAAPGAEKAEYQKGAQNAEEGQLDMLRRLALPPDAFTTIRDRAVRGGIVFLASVFDQSSADLVDALDVPAFKIPSGEITNHDLLTYVARKGRPMLISTGMCSIAEVGDALGVVRAAGNPPVALFHCVTSYPASPADCNLRAIETMQAAFGVPVGWSDHTLGTDITLAAVASGAALLEKHFTLDRTLPGPDHRASLEPDELAEMVRGVRRIELALGDGAKRPAAAEVPLAAVARRSLHTSRALAAGTVLTARDLVALRPGSGIPPSRCKSVVGRTLARPLPALALLSEADLA